MQNLSNSLTSTQKIQIACSQDWKCKSCARVLHWSFEIDSTDISYDTNAKPVTSVHAVCLTCYKAKVRKKRQRMQHVVNQSLATEEDVDTFLNQFRYTKQCRSIVTKKCNY